MTNYREILRLKGLGTSEAKHLSKSECFAQHRLKSLQKG